MTIRIMGRTKSAALYKNHPEVCAELAVPVLAPERTEGWEGLECSSGQDDPLMHSAPGLMQTGLYMYSVHAVG